MDDAPHYRRRAEACLREANDATLANVRDRWTAAATSFVRLAERRERVARASGSSGQT